MFLQLLYVRQDRTSFTKWISSKMHLKYIEHGEV